MPADEGDGSTKWPHAYLWYVNIINVVRHIMLGSLDFVNVEEMIYVMFSISGSAIICPRSIVELVCHIKKIKVYKLTNCDIASDKWQKVS